MAYSVKHSGDESTTDYRLYILENGKAISWLNDIPLWADKAAGIANMVVEIPKGTNAKMEICLNEPLNPIKQDVKNGKLRLVDHVFPYTGYVWNYGAFPQTWEDPTHKHAETGCLGDCDPLDVCEIGSRTASRGEVIQVKIIGVIALIDEGETDWKVIVIDVNDELAPKINDVDDLEREKPGYTFAMYEWLRTYKMPAGKPANEFAFNGAAKDRAYAMQVVEENSEFWNKLVVRGETPHKCDKYHIECCNHNVEGSQFKVDQAPTIEYKEHVALPTPADPYVDCGGIKGHVEAQQRRSAHGRSSLSKAISDLASLGDGTSVEATDYIVKIARGHAGAYAAGVYQLRTPHANPFSRAHAGELKIDDKEVELVAAVFSDSGAFTYSSGVGLFRFTRDGDNLTLADGGDLPEALTGADCVLGATLPLAYLKEQK